MITIRLFIIAALIVLSGLFVLPDVAAQIVPQKKVLPFDLDQITLLPGPFKSAMDRKCNYLRMLDNNRLLYSFRANHKLSTQGASQYGGWEAMAIRGHTLGHVLSALAQAYASTGDVCYKDKADSLVTELQKCQNAAVSAGFSAGYLAAIPESDVNTLLNGGSIWAPLYNIHKTFAGLLDCYELLNNQTALSVATKLGDWTYTKLSPFNHAKYQTFWDNRQSAAGEFGGYNESLAELYRITKTEKYLTAAHFFDHDKLFNPCLAGQDALNGLHANTSIPEIIGALKIYETSGDANAYKIAQNFFSIVVGAHTYINGGNSQNEYFRAPDAIASQLTDDNCETCNVYNMLKLAGRLFCFDPQPKYMDYYERALYNQILASQDTSSSTGRCTYFQPMRSGGIKIYQSDFNDFKCCDGTGLENHTKYGEHIYLHAADTLFVNLFIASKLTWTSKNMTVTMETSYPQSDTIRLTIQGSGSMPLKIHAPFWLRKTASVTIDDIPQPITAQPGTYFTINKAWSGSSVVTIVLPQTIRFEKTPDNATMGGVMYGAQVLAGCYGTTNLNTTPGLNAGLVQKTSSYPLKFSGTASTGAITLVPFYQMHNQRYSVYWNLTNVPSDTFIVATAQPFIPSNGLHTATSTVTILKSQIQLEFSTPLVQATPVTIRFFAINGVQLSTITSTIRAGTSSKTIAIPRNRSNRVNACSISIGTQTSRHLL
ncbi:MAG: beta-L-arabinofuranosidase domain-containing protein [Fibrobacterota bacterium]|nr:beta-L-arabinofuranosidase domain-containing protein [Chitinispirillaceae bacterium]